jgi:hypothetical protein
MKFDCDRLLVTYKATETYTMKHDDSWEFWAKNYRQYTASQPLLGLVDRKIGKRIQNYTNTNREICLCVNAVNKIVLFILVLEDFHIGSMIQGPSEHSLHLYGSNPGISSHFVTFELNSLLELLL